MRKNDIYVSDNFVAHELFQVSVKAFIQKGKRVLIVRAPKTRLWDLPGGRIHKNEPGASIKDTLKRELTEELGRGLKVEIGDVVQAYKISFRSLVKVFNKDKKKKFQGGVIVIVFGARLMRGTPRLSRESEEFKWADKNSIKVIPLPLWHKRALRKFFRQIASD